MEMEAMEMEAVEMEAMEMEAAQIGGKLFSHPPVAVRSRDASLHARRDASPIIGMRYG